MEIRSLREWRLKRGYGLLEFARLTGLSATTLIALEASRSRGYGRTWRKVAAALGIEPDQILEYRRVAGLDAGASSPGETRTGADGGEEAQSW